MVEIKTYDHNPTGGLVAGRWYEATMNNGAVFTFWVPRKLTRKEARAAALKFADPHDHDIYGAEDIESVRSVKLNRDGI